MQKAGEPSREGPVGRNWDKRMVGRSGILKVLFVGDSPAGDRRAGPWLRTSKTLHGSM